MNKRSKTLRQEIAHELAKLASEDGPPIRLRLDKIVLRVQARLRGGLLMAVPDGMTVLVTMIAPIKLPAKTATSLEETVKGLLKRSKRKRDWTGELHGNKVRLRIISDCDKFMEKAFLLVHNYERDSALLLDRAETLLKAAKE